MKKNIGIVFAATLVCHCAAPCKKVEKASAQLNPDKLTTAKHGIVTVPLETINGALEPLLASVGPIMVPQPDIGIPLPWPDISVALRNLRLVAASDGSLRTSLDVALTGIPGLEQVSLVVRTKVEATIQGQPRQLALTLEDIEDAKASFDDAVTTLSGALSAFLSGRGIPVPSAALDALTRAVLEQASSIVLPTMIEAVSDALDKRKLVSVSAPPFISNVRVSGDRETMTLTLLANLPTTSGHGVGDVRKAPQTDNEIGLLLTPGLAVEVVNYATQDQRFAIDLKSKKKGDYSLKLQWLAGERNPMKFYAFHEAKCEFYRMGGQPYAVLRQGKVHPGLKAIEVEDYAGSNWFEIKLWFRDVFGESQSKTPPVVSWLTFTIGGVNYRMQATDVRVSRTIIGLQGTLVRHEPE